MKIEFGMRGFFVAGSAEETKQCVIENPLALTQKSSP